MANNENLKPLTELCKEDAKAIRSKGGKARAKKIKKLKRIREYLEQGLNIDIQDKQGNIYSRKEAGVLKLIERYVKGDPKAFDTVVELLGENPAKKFEFKGAIPQVVVATEQDAELIRKIQNVKADENLL